MMSQGASFCHQFLNLMRMSSQAEHQASLTRDDIQPILSRGRPLIAAFERIQMEPLGGKGLSAGMPV